MKVHLVDGTYELFRAFFGAPPATDPEGREVGATRGLVMTLAGLLRQKDVTHVAVAFDTIIESFRNDLFDGYKTGEGMDPELHSQFPRAEEACEAMGVVPWRMRDFEADDALATGAKRYRDHPEVQQVVLCSPDKDIGQCVRSDQVVLLDRRRKIQYDEEGIHQKMGVGPRSIPDLLALVGDTADGIPGLPRWGMKSTGAVLSHYEHLESIPPNSDQWEVKVRGAARLSTVLEEHRQEATLYRTLARLREDVPLEERLEDLEWKGADRLRLQEFCRGLGSEKLADRVPNPTANS